MELKPGYRQTEVGIMPEEWSVHKTSEFGQIVTGGTPSTNIASYWGEDYPWVTPTDISERKEISTTERWLSVQGLDCLRKLPAGTVLVTCIASIGKNAILRVSGACNQQINAIVPNRDHDSGFLYYLFEASKQYLLANAGITATSILSKSRFAELEFYLPPLPEQRAIAAALSDVDALISSLDRLIAKKRAIKHGAVQQLLTRKTRLPGFSGEWEARRLGELGYTFGGLTGKTKADFGRGSAKYIPFLNVMNNVVIDSNQLDIVNVHYNESQNSIVKGDIFFNGSSETPEEVGMCAVLLDDIEGVYLNSFCFGFRFYRDALADGLYLAYFFRSGEGRELLYALAQGATRHNLSKVALMALEFGLPTLVEQRAIATVLSDVDAEIAALEARSDKTRALKQGMMQELLTGKTRLI